MQSKAGAALAPFEDSQALGVERKYFPRPFGVHIGRRGAEGGTLDLKFDSEVQGWVRESGHSPRIRPAMSFFVFIQANASIACIS